jgi:hypothetical protein
MSTELSLAQWGCWEVTQQQQLLFDDSVKERSSNKITSIGRAMNCKQYNSFFLFISLSQV